MIFQQRNLNTKSHIVSFNNEKIENVTEYKFLGTLIKNNGNLSSSLLICLRKLRKHYFQLKLELLN